MEETYRGYKIKIEQDQDPLNPREDFDCNATIMVCMHKRYSLGDKHAYRSEDYTGWSELEHALRKHYNPVVIKPLYLYDHSGITIATTQFHCPWDSGQVGFALVPREKALDIWGVKRITQGLRHKIEQSLELEVEIYDRYLRGEIYGYTTHTTHNEDNSDVIDSCWGFYSEKEALAEAKSTIDSHITHGAPLEARTPCPA